MRQAVHVVDLSGQQQLADVAEHRIGHEHAAVLIARGIHAGRHTAGIEAFGDLDEFHHGLTQRWGLVHIQAVGLRHQRARADQQVAKPRPRGDAGVAVVRRIAVGQHRAVFPLVDIEHPIPGHEDAIEDAHGCGLPVLGGEQRLAMFGLLAGPPGRARDDGQARCIDRHRTAHREGRIGLAHVAAGHDQQFMHVRCAGDDGLGAADHDALGIALHRVHIGVGVGLLVGLAAALALGVRHRHPQRQIGVLHMGQVGLEAIPVLTGAACVVYGGHRLGQAIEGVLRQIALRAARFLAQQSHILELVEQVAAGLIEVQHAADLPAAVRLRGQGQRRPLRLERRIVGVGQRVDPRPQRRFIGHAGHFVPVHEHPRLQASQRFAVGRAVHQVHPRRRLAVFQRGVGGAVHGLAFATEMGPNSTFSGLSVDRGRKWSLTHFLDRSSGWIP